MTNDDIYNAPILLRLGFGENHRYGIRVIPACDSTLMLARTGNSVKTAGAESNLPAQKRFSVIGIFWLTEAR